MSPKKPKPPDTKATEESLKALQDLFSGVSLAPVAQSEVEQRKALDELFPGLNQKPLGMRKAEKAWQKATIVQKRHRVLDPIEVEALAQSAVVQSRIQRRTAQRKAEQRLKLAQLRNQAGAALQTELGRIARSLATSLKDAAYRSWVPQE